MWSPLLMIPRRNRENPRHGQAAGEQVPGEMGIILMIPPMLRCTYMLFGTVTSLRRLAMHPAGERAGDGPPRSYPLAKLGGFDSDGSESRYVGSGMGTFRLKCWPNPFVQRPDSFSRVSTSRGIGMQGDFPAPNLRHSKPKFPVPHSGEGQSKARQLQAGAPHHIGSGAPMLN